MIESHKRHSISVVTPVYNGEASIGELCRRLAEVLPRISAQHEIILVNDGSRDRSWETISELCSRSPSVRGLNLMRNYGQHNALLCGIRAARHEIVVTMDDDLQHPPEEIPQLLAELARGEADVVYGRPEREQHGFWRNLASRATKLGMEQMIGATNARDISSFRAFRTHLRDGFANFQSPFVSIDVLLTWSTARTTAIDVRRDARKIGKSNYTTWKLVMGTVNVVTAFSTVPLRLATLLGFFMALLGSGILVFVLGNDFLHGSVPGFPFLACIITIFAGAQLLALGVIGEYLGRMFMRSMGTPIYAVKEAIGSQPEPATTETHSTNESS